MSEITSPETIEHAGSHNGGHRAHPIGESVIARFMELRGRRIVKACGTTWCLGPGRFLMSLPYHTLLDPDPLELRSMIRETKAFGARFPSASWSGLESGIYVMRAPEYGLESVHEQHRERVHQGMQTYHVRPATKTQLLNQGRALNLELMARYGRYDPELGERRRWETFVEAAFACSAISVPAAFRGSRMAAYMITCREHRWLHILHHMSPQEPLAGFPNEVLTYSVTQQAAADPAVDVISYGYVPLCTADSLHEYKVSFGYDVTPHHAAIQLHPVLDAIFNSRLARAAVHVARCIRREYQPAQTLESILEGAHSSAPSGLAPRPC
jgi:hypothetical protein